MPQSQLAGDRARRSRSPRDVTGREYARLLAEQKAKQEAADLDIREVRRLARAEGFREGFDQGFTSGWNSLAEYMVREGILDPDEDERQP